MAQLGMSVTHLYGLTETYGPVAINQWQPSSADLDERGRVLMAARQGVGNVISAALRVVDVDGRDVPPDGQTVGEIVCRGNNLMLGYYNDDEATKAVTVDGCFRTGDLGVMHPDGYVEIRDRGKDIIISGGENIASVEVERVLDAHPAVLESAVVSRPDDVWGEVPVAFVTLRSDAHVTAAELVTWVRDRLAHFKAPKQVNFGPLPKTSTGKIQKSALRARVRA
jgi:fatty-acyl-CoA synthase